jgi:hypothetical protein
MKITMIFLIFLSLGSNPEQEEKVFYELKFHFLNKSPFNFSNHLYKDKKSCIRDGKKIGYKFHCNKISFLFEQEVEK